MQGIMVLSQRTLLPQSKLVGMESTKLRKDKPLLYAIGSSFIRVQQKDAKIGQMFTEYAKDDGHPTSLMLIIPVILKIIFPKKRNKI